MIAVAADDRFTRQVNFVIRVLVLFRNRLNPVEELFVVEPFLVK